MKAQQPVARHLRQLQADAFAAFALPLRDRSGPLYCDRLLKLIPSQHAVFHGRYAEQEVQIKVWFGPRHLADCQREASGLQALADAGCLTLLTRHTGTTSDQAATVLVQSWLPDTDNLLQRWPRLRTEAARSAELLALADSIAAQHLAGLYLRDPHLGLYLHTGVGLVVLEGDRLLRTDAPLPVGDGLDNLAQLFALLPPAVDGLLAQAWARYAQRRFGEAPEEWSQFRKRLDRLRLRRLQDVQQRCLNGQAHWLKAATGADGRQVLMRRGVPDAAVESRLLTADLQTPDSAWQAFAGAAARRFPVRPSAARQRLAMAHVLESFDVLTPTPIACVEPQARDSVYLSEAMSSQPLTDWLGAHPERASDLAAPISAWLQQLDSLQLSPMGEWLPQLQICDRGLLIRDPLCLQFHRSARQHRKAMSRARSALQTACTSWPALENALA